MGEGLTVDEARDAAFLLTGAGMWVRKLAYLTTNPMTIQGSKRPIAQAVSDHRVKVRGPGHPCVNLPDHQPFWFNPPRSSPPKDVSGNCSSNYPPSPCWPSRGWDVTGMRETKGLNHLGSLHLPQNMGLRVTGVHYQQLPQCGPGLTSQTDQDIPHKIDNIERKKPA